MHHASCEISASIINGRDDKEQWTQSMSFAAVISDWFYIIASRLPINEKSTKPFFFLDLEID